MKVEIANKYYNKSNIPALEDKNRYDQTDPCFLPSFPVTSCLGIHLTWTVDCRCHSMIGKFSKRHVTYLVKASIKMHCGTFEMLPSCVKRQQWGNVSPAAQGDVQLKH